MASSKLASFGSSLLDSLPSSKGELQQFLKGHKWELLVAAACGYLCYKLIEQYNLPPGPYGLPVIGYMLHTEGMVDGSEQKKIKAKYGDIASIKVGSE